MKIGDSIVFAGGGSYKIIGEKDEISFILETLEDQGFGTRTKGEIFPWEKAACFRSAKVVGPKYTKNLPAWF